MKETQGRAVLKHLETVGPLTSKEAFELYGCTRLAAQISNLRKLGYNIITLDCKGTTRYGTFCNYAKYVLIKEEK